MKRKVRLRMKEQLQYETIKTLVESSGNKRRAALKLGVSVRHINRLIGKYCDNGKAGFVHKNRARRPSNSLPQELCNTIILHYTGKYQGFNIRHFQDLLKQREGIAVSYGSLYCLLMRSGFISPKAQRRTRRAIAKARLQKQGKPHKPDEEQIIDHQLAIEDAHPRQQRKRYFGEELQMDASIHQWFGSDKTALHLAIDNATGMIVGGFFDKQETLFGYYTIFKQILENYGVPYLFKTDNRTVFNYEKRTYKQDHNDVLTQFGYACKTLGVSIETTSVSQSKGMIERANGTFQGRLVNELHLEGITDIIKANEYLINEFIPSFNRLFAIDYHKFGSVFEKAPDAQHLNLILAVLSPRTIDNGSAIKYLGGYYALYSPDGNLACFKSKTKCLVIKAYDGGLFAAVDNKTYSIIKIERNRKLSEQFDSSSKEPRKSTAHVPPMSHPWRCDSFIKQQQRAHRWHQYT